jgi:hypothetical protein
MKALVATVFVFLPFTAPAVSAQEEPPPGSMLCLAETQRARTIEVAGRPPYAVFAVSGALRHDCTILAFYDATPSVPGEAPAVIHVRRWRADILGKVQIDFADSRRCGGAIKAARALETFHPAGVRLPALNRSNLVTVTVDGASFWLWSNEAGTQSADGFEFNVEGSNYPGLDDVEKNTERALRSCWLPTAPR